MKFAIIAQAWAILTRPTRTRILECMRSGKGTKLITKGTNRVRKIAELAAQVATLQASSSVTNAMFAEAYYYLTIPLMVLIHPRFLVYEIVHPG